MISNEIGVELKIALFTEVYDCGGIDTFIVNLINHWPIVDDSFVIISNNDYPCLEVIRNRITHSTHFMAYKKITYSNILKGNIFLKFIREALSPVIRYLIFFYNVIAFRKILLISEADALLVINGGYPGADSCRAATISWGIFSGKPNAIHNFHNLTIGARWYHSLQELVVEWLLCKYTKKFVTVSLAAAESIILRPTICSRNMTLYIYNWLEINRSQSLPLRSIKDEIGIPESTPLCLMLGTYEPRKGHLFLLRAFRKVLESIPDAHLLICGFGLKHEIELVNYYVRTLRLERSVHLMGFKTDIEYLLGDTSILVVPSQAYESFGYVSLEAMAYKVPVVATNVGGIPEVVINGEGGYCVDKNDFELFGRRIIDLLKDENLRFEQGNRGYERFQNNFTASVMSFKYAEMLHGNIVSE